MGGSDIETIKDAGLDKFLSRVKGAGKIANPFTKYTEATNISGGTLGNNAIFNVGSKQVKIDGPKSRITVNDGANDRILFGKREDGTFGIDVSSSGFDVHSAYEGEMDLTSKATDAWTSLNPNNFTYSDANTITISNYTPSSVFQIGDKIKLVQTTAKYFYITRVNSGTINVRAGTDYTVANATITEFYFAREKMPSDFTDWFTVDTGLTAQDDDGDTLTLGSMKYDYKMTGDILIMRPNLNFDVNADATSYVQFTKPFQEAASKTVALGEQAVASGATGGAFMVFQDAGSLANGDDDKFALSTVGGTIAGFTAFGFRNLIYAQVLN